jgi:hypothetical protein
MEKVVTRVLAATRLVSSLAKVVVFLYWVTAQPSYLDQFLQPSRSKLQTERAEGGDVVE